MVHDTGSGEREAIAGCVVGQPSWISARPCPRAHENSGLGGFDDGQLAERDRRGMANVELRMAKEGVDGPERHSVRSIGNRTVALSGSNPDSGLALATVQAYVCAQTCVQKCGPNDAVKQADSTLRPRRTDINTAHRPNVCGHNPLCLKFDENSRPALLIIIMMTLASDLGSFYLGQESRKQHSGKRKHVGPTGHQSTGGKPV